MKWIKGILYLTFMCIGVNIYSQVGVRVTRNANNISPDPIILGLDDGYEIGIDYWFRLKNKRIEFLPEVSYEMADAAIVINPPGISFRSLNISLNTNIYPFDFYNDCDCPTFSKEGGPLNKGLHLIINSGIRYYSWENERISDEKKIGFMAGVGLGLDIGVNDLITISPSFVYRFSFKKELEYINDLGGDELIEMDNRQAIFGIRLGLRPDYQTPGFRR